MASSRKNSMTGLPPPLSSSTSSLGMAAPNARAPLTKPSAAVSTAYLEALKVLSEDTMNRACELLLSDRDYSTAQSSSSLSGTAVATTTGTITADDDASSATNHTTAADETNKSLSDLEQMEELYRTCCKAAKVLEKEAAHAAKTPLPSLPTAPAARSSALLLPSSALSRGSITGASGGIKLGLTNASMTIPNRRLAGRLPTPVPSKLGHAATASLSGSNSAAPFATAASVGHNSSHNAASSTAASHKRGMLKDNRGDKGDAMATKKARSTSPTPSSLRSSNSSIQSTGSSDTLTGSKGAPLPPPSARQFLAKLNDQPKGGKAAAAAKPKPKLAEPASPHPVATHDDNDDDNDDHATSLAASHSSPKSTASTSSSGSSSPGSPTTPSPSPKSGRSSRGGGGSSGRALSTRAKSAPPLPPSPTPPPPSGATRTQPPRASRK
jgi:trimeric autotransporter adhesin